MSDGIDQAFEVLEKVAGESGHRIAFYEGVVVGLAHIKGFSEQDEIPLTNAVWALLELIDERIFKPLEKNPQ